MARTLIQNISGTPLTLPLPYSVVLPPSGAVVVSDTIPVVEGHLYVLPGMNYNISLTDVPEGNSVGLVPPVVSMGGQKLTGLGTPTAGTDAATKAYVDSTAGGTGTVTSITAGTGLSGGTITASGTIALATPVATSNGGTGVAAGTSNGVFSASNGVGAVTPLVYATRTIGAEVADTIPVAYQMKNGAANFTAEVTFWGQIIQGTLAGITLSAGAAGQVVPMGDFATSGRFVMISDAATGIMDLNVNTAAAETVGIAYGPGPGTEQLFLGGVDEITFA